MSDENEREVYKQHRAAQEKYVYFLLAPAGAAIAFAATQTASATLHWDHAPLGAAVFCWAASFFCGSRHLTYVAVYLFSNVELMRVEGGRHPHTGKHPQIIAAAAEGIRSAMISNNERASRFGHWQFRLLVAGAIFYVGWHVLEMYLRAASA